MKTLILALVLAPALLRAQTPAPTPTPTRLPLWRATLEGGTYEVALRSIVSVSTHEYIVDGVARVYELNVDTTGNSAVRFYFLEPIKPGTPDGIGQSALDRAEELSKQITGRITSNTGSEPPWEKVMKNYPTSTHAHTVEYRLDSRDDIDKLFKSADLAFRLNQNTEVKVP